MVTKGGPAGGLWGSGGGLRDPGEDWRVQERAGRSRGGLKGPGEGWRVHGRAGGSREGLAGPREG